MSKLKERALENIPRTALHPLRTQIVVILKGPEKSRLGEIRDANADGNLLVRTAEGSRLYPREQLAIAQVALYKIIYLVLIYVTF